LIDFIPLVPPDLTSSLRDRVSRLRRLEPPPQRSRDAV